MLCRFGLIRNPGYRRRNTLCTAPLQLRAIHSSRCKVVVAARSLQQQICVRAVRVSATDGVLDPRFEPSATPGGKTLARRESSTILRVLGNHLLHPMASSLRQLGGRMTAWIMWQGRVQNGSILRTVESAAATPIRRVHNDMKPITLSLVWHRRLAVDGLALTSETLRGAQPSVASSGAAGPWSAGGSTPYPGGPKFVGADDRDTPSQKCIVFSSSPNPSACEGARGSAAARRASTISRSRSPQER
jgi:hypothetical protein